VAKNQAVDAGRFISPPVVTFGGTLSGSTVSGGAVSSSVSVQADDRMTCLVPAGTAGQTVPVYVSYNGGAAQVGTYTYTQNPDPSVGVAVNGKASPAVSGWPSGASVDAETNALTLRTGNYTLATDDAWTEDTSSFADHYLSIAPGAQVSIAVVPSPGGRPLIFNPLSAVTDGIDVGQGASLLITSTGGAGSATYLYCRGNEASNLSGIGGQGALTISGQTVLYAYGSGSSPGIGCGSTKITGGSVWTQAANGAFPSVSPAPSGSVAGKALAPVYLSSAQYGSTGVATIPSAGASGNLASDYQVPLSDMGSVGGSALTGVSGVAWLPS
jgi:hypothetical protein